MKPELISLHRLVHGHLPVQLRPLGLGVMLVIYSSELVFAGKPFASSSWADNSTDDLLQLEPGPIGVISTTRPALWSCDLPRGQVQRPAQAAHDAAQAVLELPAIDPHIDLLLSAVGVVGAPVAAMVSGLHASRAYLPANRLTEVQAGLFAAMTNMAQQHHLCEAIVAAGQVSRARRFVLLAAADATGAAPFDQQRVASVLETSVTELRLERLGSGDASFALRIEARARLLRQADAAVLSDTTFTYQTPPDLFLDWALNRGEPFEKCARTGYRQIANQILATIHRQTGEALLLVGSGQKTFPAPHRSKGATLKQQSNPIALVATIQLASLARNEATTIYVVPAPGKKLFTVQKPWSRQDALTLARSDINAAADEAIRHPNVCVGLAGLAVLAPLSIYHQTIGLAFHGVSEKQIRLADRSMTNVIHSAQPAETLANQLVQHLGQRDFGNIVLLPSSGLDPALLARSPTTTTSRIPAAWSASASDFFRSNDKLLSIEVIKEALTGAGGSNPQLTVCLEARVTLQNARDGQVLHTSNVRYQGDALKYSQWAANDARRFRAELARGYAELSAAALEQMEAPGWINPAHGLPAATIAGH